MNQWALNSYVLNGAGQVPVVYTGASSMAYASSSVRIRVFVSAQVSSSPSAQVSSARCRVLQRVSTGCSPSALVGPTIVRVLVRSPANLQPAASVWFDFINRRINLTCSPRATVSESIKQRVFVSSGVQAAAVESPAVRRLVRPVTAVAPSAVLTPEPTIYIRRPVRVPIGLYGLVNVVARVRLVSRLVVSEGPTAALVPAVRIRARLVIAMSCRATATYGYSIIRRIPWDEPAPLDRRFKVVPTQLTFKVTS